jgi:hypothetical protein
MLQQVAGAQAPLTLRLSQQPMHCAAAGAVQPPQLPRQGGQSLALLVATALHSFAACPVVDRLGSLSPHEAKHVAQQGGRGLLQVSACADRPLPELLLWLLRLTSCLLLWLLPLLLPWLLLCFLLPLHRLPRLHQRQQAQHGLCRRHPRCHLLAAGKAGHPAKGHGCSQAQHRICRKAAVCGTAVVEKPCQQRQRRQQLPCRAGAGLELQFMPARRNAIQVGKGVHTAQRP